MQKAPIAVLAVCVIAIVGLTIYLYTLTHSAGSLATLLILVPFGWYLEEKRQNKPAKLQRL